MSIARLITKTLLLLPESIIINMAGKKPLEIDGRTLDARTHFLGAQGAKAPSIKLATPAAARAAARAAFEITNAPLVGGVKVSNSTIKANDGTSLPVRFYRPKKAESKIPAILFYHMGGWVIGDLDTCDNFCSLLSARIGALVMSLDYRLAPENKFPTAMEDGFTAYLWLRDNAENLKIDLNHIAIGGDSAGGCMAAITCQEMKRRGVAQPQVQMLIYPATDLSARTGSMESCAMCQPLTAEVMEWFSENWLNDESDKANQLASPMAGDISGDLAPSLIVTAGFDPLRDQGQAYADKLREAGVNVRYYCEDSLCHAFTAYGGVVPKAASANERLAKNLKEMI